MNIEEYFKDKKGITVDAAFKCGMKYTAIDLCRFAKKYSERTEMHKVLKEELAQLRIDLRIADKSKLLGKMANCETRINRIESLIKEVKL